MVMIIHYLTLIAVHSWMGCWQYELVSFQKGKKVEGSEIQLENGIVWDEVRPIYYSS